LIISAIISTLRISPLGLSSSLIPKIKLGENILDSIWLKDTRIVDNYIHGAMQKIVLKEKTLEIGTEKGIVGYPYKTPVLYTSNFTFVQQSPLHIIVHGGSQIANAIVPEIETILFPGQKKKIVRKKLSKTDIKRIYESTQGGDVRNSTFKDLEHKNLSKGSIWGPNVEKASVFADFDNIGRISYIMYYAEKYDMLISINDDCQVTFYKKVSEEFANKFIEDEIL